MHSKGFANVMVSTYSPTFLDCIIYHTVRYLSHGILLIR